MPGSWEYERPSVLVAILTRGVVPIKWAISFRDMQIPHTGKPVFLSGMPFDHARNVAVETALSQNFTHLLFLDDDVMPPPDVYYRLAAHNLDIVSGLYHRRQNPIVPVALKSNGNGGYEWVTTYDKGSLIDVDLVGAGCLLIHRMVLERMSKPWFDWLIDRDDVPAGERVSEDFAFCIKAKKMGLSIKLDTSVECAHAGYGYSDSDRYLKPLEL